MNREDLLLKAVRLLQEDADAEQESCAIGDQQWACADCKKDADGRCNAQRNVEDRRSTAAALTVLSRV